MSLGIAFKGPEGIVLAADSRITLTTVLDRENERMLLPATFDNGTKLLSITNQKYVGFVTYGAGAIGIQSPRSAHSYLPEFEDVLKKEGNNRLKVLEFTEILSKFFMDQWEINMPSEYSGPDITFLVGGYDENEPYGKLFEVNIPRIPKPREWHSGKGMFGPVWGGQLEFTSRIIHGYDPSLTSIIQEFLKISDDQKKELENHLRSKLNIRIPYQFLSLQDCVNLSKLLIQITHSIQSFYVGIRGVGGSIDIATITRTEGFKHIKKKEITSEWSKINIFFIRRILNVPWN